MQFKGRFDFPGSPRVHSVEIWFSADNFMQAAQDMMDFCSTNGYPLDSVSKLIDVTPEVATDGGTAGIPRRIHRA